MKLAGVALMVAFAVSPWEWSIQAAALIGLATFWRELGELSQRAMVDVQIRALRRDGCHGNVGGNARIAWEARGGREDLNLSRGAGRAIRAASEVIEAICRRTAKYANHEPKVTRMGTGVNGNFPV